MLGTELRDEFVIDQRFGGVVYDERIVWLKEVFCRWDGIWLHLKGFWVFLEECDHCGNVFRDENFHDLYIAIGEFLVIFKCSICKLTVDFGIELNIHMKSKHIKFLWDWWELAVIMDSEVAEILVVFEKMKENLFKCDVCDFGVVTGNWVDEHMRIKHEDNVMALGEYG